MLQLLHVDAYRLSVVPGNTRMVQKNARIIKDYLQSGLSPRRSFRHDGSLTLTKPGVLTPLAPVLVRVR